MTTPLTILCPAWTLVNLPLATTMPPICRLRRLVITMRTKSAFHSTEISGPKSNGTGKVLGKIFEILEIRFWADPLWWNIRNYQSFFVLFATDVVGCEPERVTGIRRFRRSRSFHCYQTFYFGACKGCYINGSCAIRILIRKLRDHEIYRK